MSNTLPHPPGLPPSVGDDRLPVFGGVDFTPSLANDLSGGLAGGVRGASWDLSGGSAGFLVEDESGAVRLTAGGSVAAGSCVAATRSCDASGVDAGSRAAGICGVGSGVSSGRSGLSVVAWLVSVPTAALDTRAGGGVGGGNATAAVTGRSGATDADSLPFASSAPLGVSSTGDRIGCDGDSGVGCNHHMPATQPATPIAANRASQ